MDWTRLIAIALLLPGLSLVTAVVVGFGVTSLKRPRGNRKNHDDV